MRGDLLSKKEPEEGMNRSTNSSKNLHILNIHLLSSTSEVIRLLHVMHNCGVVLKLLIIILP